MHVFSGRSDALKVIGYGEYDGDVLVVKGA